MGAGDKFENNVDKAAGAAKEKLGKATGNESQQAEGRAQQSQADLKKAGESVKDAFKN